MPWPPYDYKTRVTDRWCSTAVTWVKNATWRLVNDNEQQPPPDDPEYSPASQDASMFIGNVIDQFHDLVPVLRGEELDSAITSTGDLLSALKTSRRAMKLEQTDGRTPEEVAAFLSKAEELRGGQR